MNVFVLESYTLFTDCRQDVSKLYVEKRMRQFQIQQIFETLLASNFYQRDFTALKGCKPRL